MDCHSARGLTHSRQGLSFSPGMPTECHSAHGLSLSPGIVFLTGDANGLSFCPWIDSFSPGIVMLHMDCHSARGLVRSHQQLSFCT